MSSNAPAVPAPPPSRMLTPEASNVLGWWWLAIVTTIVLLCSMWPSIFPDTSAGGLASTSNYLLVIVCAALIALGAWCAHGFAQAKPWSARVMRLVAMIGLGVGLVGVGLFLYSVAFASASPDGTTFFGPSGVLAGIMWALIMILPFIFGLTLIFGLMNDAVDEWFSPVINEPTQTSLRIDPKTAAMMASSATAASLGDEELMEDLSQAMSLTHKSAKYDETDQSIEVIGSSEDDVSVEVVGNRTVERSDSMEELAALERALTQDASKKAKDKKTGKTKQEKKLDIGHGDEPLKVDDDFKL